MSWANRTMIVPVAFVPLARALAVGVSPIAGRGMFETPLSPTGALPATHFMSAGFISAEFARAVEDAGYLFAACARAGAPVTLEQCTLLAINADVTDEPPFSAMARLELQMIVSEE